MTFIASNKIIRCGLLEIGTVLLYKCEKAYYIRINFENFWEHLKILFQKAQKLKMYLFNLSFIFFFLHILNHSLSFLSIKINDFHIKYVFCFIEIFIWSEGWIYVLSFYILIRITVELSIKINSQRRPKKINSIKIIHIKIIFWHVNRYRAKK